MCKNHDCQTRNRLFLLLCNRLTVFLVSYHWQNNNCRTTYTNLSLTNNYYGCCSTSVLIECLWSFNSFKLRISIDGLNVVEFNIKRCKIGQPHVFFNQTCVYCSPVGRIVVIDSRTVHKWFNKKLLLVSSFWNCEYTWNDMTSLVYIPSKSQDLGSHICMYASVYNSLIDRNIIIINRKHKSMWQLSYAYSRAKVKGNQSR